MLDWPMIFSLSIPTVDLTDKWGSTVTMANVKEDTTVFCLKIGQGNGYRRAVRIGGGGGSE